MTIDRLPANLWDQLDELRQRARQHPDGLIDLSKGTPVDRVPDIVQRALATAADAPGYPLTSGTATLLEAAAGWLARRHDVTVETSGIMPTIGSKELLGLLPLLLGLGPDDAVVYPELAYPSYHTGARLVGAMTAAIDDPSVGDPVLASGHRIRLVWLNSPSNPTGRVLPAATMRRIVEWARSRGVVVASDECYLDYGWERQPTSLLAPRIAGQAHAGLLAVHSLSKRSNLAGYRAGFIAGDPDLIRPLLHLRREIGLITPAPVQYAMVAALQDDTHVRHQRRRYAHRREILKAALLAAGWKIDHSQAGLFLWARSPGHDCWAAAALLADAGILATPGNLYGKAGRRHVRIAITASDERIAAAAARLGVAKV